MPKTVNSESENRTVGQFLWEGHVNEKNTSRVPGEIAGTATTSRTLLPYAFQKTWRTLASHRQKR